MSASASWQLDPRWTARAGLGVVTGGSLTSSTGTVHDFKPGGLVSFAAEYRGSAGSGWTPSLDYSLALGVTWAKTEAADTSDRTGYFAADLRLGARASWLLAGRTMGYAGGRVFGGPVSWEIEGNSVTGTDTHHYQLAVGLASQVASLGLFAEWAALGEQGFSAGLSTVW